MVCLAAGWMGMVMFTDAPQTVLLLLACVLDVSPNINHLRNLELAFLSLAALAIEKWVATSLRKVGS